MFAALPPVTRTLLLVNVGIFISQYAIGPLLFQYFALWPPSQAGSFGLPGVGDFAIWQLVTYAFLHGSPTPASSPGAWMHLVFNMLALFMFGSEIERVWGRHRYTVYYFACVIGAALAQLTVVTLQGGRPYATVGASGGVFGLLLAFGMMFPRRMILLIIPPIPMPAWLFVTLYGIIELVLGVTRTQSGVAHFAHLGGMAAGFVLIQYWRGRGPFRRR